MEKDPNLGLLLAALNRTVRSTGLHLLRVLSDVFVHAGSYQIYDKSMQTVCRLYVEICHTVIHTYIHMPICLHTYYVYIHTYVYIHSTIYVYIHMSTYILYMSTYICQHNSIHTYTTSLHTYTMYMYACMTIIHYPSADCCISAEHRRRRCEAVPPKLFTVFGPITSASRELSTHILKGSR
eukprot:COSAG05_NODE_2475_length_3014_cov_3.392453_1_plen_181_part_00